MATVYVVREGKVRGEGRYASGATSDTSPDWNGRLEAWTYEGPDARRNAERYARLHGGRVVRLVTLGEQLRRARKQIAALDKAARWAAQGHLSRRAEMYAKGRADERKAVVEWLEKEVEDYERIGMRDAAVTVQLRVDEIESGEHVKGGG